MSTAYVQGVYLPMAEATVPMQDRAYHFGDAVYEVIAFFNRRFLDEEPHLKRLERSLGELHIQPPMTTSALKLVMRELLRRNPLEHGGFYLQVSRGSAKRDHAFPLATTRSGISMFLFPPKTPSAQLMRKGVKVITGPDMRWGRCDIKTVGLLPNVLSKQEAVEAGARETWLYREDGQVTEGAVSNAYIVLDGAVVTHPLGNAILGGVTRDVVLALARKDGIPVEERSFSLEEARRAREAFLTSTTSNVLPITAIDEKPVGDGKTGPVTTRLIELYSAHVASQTGYRLPSL